MDDLAHIEFHSYTPSSSPRNRPGPNGSNEPSNPSKNLRKINGVVVLFILSVVAVIWGSCVLVVDYGARHECYDIWSCVLCMVIYVWQNIIITIMKKVWHAVDNQFVVLSIVMGLVVIIWPIVIYAKLDTECRQNYKENYENLWLFFTVFFWGYVATLCMNMCHSIKEEDL